MPGEFPLSLPPPFNFPQSDLGRRADSRWALPQISSFVRSVVLHYGLYWLDGSTVLREGLKSSTASSYLLHFPEH